MTHMQCAPLNGKPAGIHRRPTKYTHTQSLECVLKSSKALPVNVKILLEGQEEIGSPNLPDILTKHKDLLSADFMLCGDGGQISKTQPSYVCVCVMYAIIHLFPHSTHHHHPNTTTPRTSSAYPWAFGVQWAWRLSCKRSIGMYTLVFMEAQWTMHHWHLLACCQPCTPPMGPLLWRAITSRLCARVLSS